MTSSFGQVVGHKNAKSFFCGIQETERIASGFLLHGDRGRGKFLLARAFIQRLFCDDGTGCLTCPPCKRFDAGTHGDVQEVTLMPGKSRISIDQLRDLREWFHRAPYEANRRCAIVDEAHLMGEEAQNSLLKLLEEPPAHGVIILVTENPQALLDTVHSRLQTVYLGPLDLEDLMTVLRGNVEATDADMAAAAALSNGSPGVAVDIILDEGSGMIREAAFRLFDLKTLPFGYSEMVSGGRPTGAELREKAKRIVEVALELVSQQLAATVRGEKDSPPVPSLAPWSVDILDDAQRLLLDAAGSLRSNTSPRSVLESLKIRMHRIIGQARRQKTVGGNR